MLEAAIAILSDDMQTQLFTQVSQKLFVQRSHRLISYPRFYSSAKTNQKLNESSELSHKLLIVELDVAGKKERAHVEFYRGLVDSIQFKHPGKFYKGKVLKVLSVKAGNPKVSHGAAIDRSEHGRQH